MKDRWRWVSGAFVAAVAVASGCAVPDQPGQGRDTAGLVVQRTVVPYQSTWSYWDRGGDLGVAWRLPGHDDSGWARGQGPLGYGESYLSTVVSSGPDPGNRHITTYFRAEFTVDDPDAVSAMVGRLMYDDGVVVYLNGQEIERQGVPAPSTAQTLAAGHEIGDAYQSFDWTAHRAVLVAGANTLAVEVHQAAKTSSDLTFDLALEMEVAETAPPTEGGIPRRSEWTYWDRGGDLGSAWRAPTHDDSAWATGAGPLGYGESYVQTVVGHGPSATSKHITTYFRADFTVDDPDLVTAMVGDLMYDDGLVVYLNGHEIGRQGVAAPSTATTRASGHEASNAYERFDWTAQVPHLVAGVNTIAVEVHQQAPSSSDLVFDLGLILTAEPPPPPVLPPEDTPRGATWSYWDRGGDLGAAWRARTFDDTAWATGAGPLGYGEAYVTTTVGHGGDAANKHITTYFRRHLTVHDPAAVVTLTAELMYDDGVVIYLNGTEIRRLHMPAGAVTAATLAPGWETGNAYERYELGNTGLLVEGDNVIAVEVHQAQRTSSDLTFDMSLTIDSTCAQPRIPVWTGTAGHELNGGSGGEADRADVTWTLARSDGCVDRYAPSGTAHRRVSASYCFEVAPESAPIEPGDGELVIDRSSTPATYTMHGQSAWAGFEGCPDPDDESGTGWHPTTLRSDWATDLRGAFELDVMGGGDRAPGDPGNVYDWAFTDAAAAFPPPLAGACVEPASDRWHTVTSDGVGTATLTWTRTATTACVDEYAPSGTMVLTPVRDERPDAFCRERRWDPSSGTVEPADGRLVIDRSVNPPTFWIRGSSSWVATETCTRPDGSVQTASVSAGGAWADEWHGPFHGDQFAGGFSSPRGPADWSFERLVGP